MLIVDRIEGKRVVCETEKGYFSVVPLAECESGVREGDVLTETEGGYRIDREQTEFRRQESVRRTKELFME